MRGHLQIVVVLGTFNRSDSSTHLNIQTSLL